VFRAAVPRPPTKINMIPQGEATPRTNMKISSNFVAGVISIFGFMAQGVKSQGQDNRPIVSEVVRDLEEVGSYAPFSMDMFASLSMAGDERALRKDAKNGKAGKGGKACGCNIKFDHDSCEDGPWIVSRILEKDGSGGYKCSRYQNTLYGVSDSAFVFLFTYLRCPSPTQMSVQPYYKTAQECLDANPDATLGVDGCPQVPPTIKWKHGCKLDISNCTTVCGRDETAYYLSANDRDFDFKDKLFNFPNLKGECAHYRPDRIQRISYGECVKNGVQYMPYKKYKNLDACCRDNGGCGVIGSGSKVWKDDKCTKDIDDEPIQASGSSQMGDKRCPTFYTCEECIDRLSTQLTSPGAAEDVDNASDLDLKYLFDYTLYQTGMMTEGESSVNVVGECGPCIDHLLDKFSTPTSVSTGEADKDIPSFFESFFGSLLNEIIGLKRVSDTDLTPLYDYLTEYSGQYLSTQNLSGERRMEKRQIDFRVRC
jgi:hypothetical protein